MQTAARDVRLYFLLDVSISSSARQRFSDGFAFETIQLAK